MDKREEKNTTESIATETLRFGIMRTGTTFHAWQADCIK